MKILILNWYWKFSNEYRWIIMVLSHRALKQVESIRVIVTPRRYYHLPLCSCIMWTTHSSGKIHIGETSFLFFLRRLCLIFINWQSYVWQILSSEICFGGEPTMINIQSDKHLSIWEGETMGNLLLCLLFPGQNQLVFISHFKNHPLCCMIFPCYVSMHKTLNQLLIRSHHNNVKKLDLF